MKGDGRENMPTHTDVHTCACASERRLEIKEETNYLDCFPIQVLKFEHLSSNS